MQPVSPLHPTPGPISRRRLVGGGACALSALTISSGRPATAADDRFGFEAVVRSAERLAQADFRALATEIPEVLRDLDVDGYRQIGFRPEHSVWRGDVTPFRLAFSHVGWRHLRPVEIAVIDGGVVAPVAYRTEMFNFGGSDTSEAIENGLGFAGFQVHYSDGDPSHFPEVARFDANGLVHLLGDNQRHGAAARALAINTATSAGEEFPIFRKFWIEKASPGTASLRVYGLLDSPSVAGAFEFVLRPGLQHAAEVRARLFPRREIPKLGIAPISSMFLFGENDGAPFDDFRPEVHDSDGLSIRTGTGDWIWRPLAYRTSLQVSAFLDQDPGGFGLAQRDRAFTNYQDLHQDFHRRPSLWVEPTGAWGPGWVELVEIPSEREVHDNILTYWVSREPVSEPKEVSYRLYAQLDQSRRPPLAHCMATRVGRSDGGEGQHFVLDFTGGALAQLPRREPVDADVKSRQGRIEGISVAYNRETGGRRVAFDLFPEGSELCEMRCALQHEQRVVSEAWVYRWTRT